MAEKALDPIPDAAMRSLFDRSGPARSAALPLALALLLVPLVSGEAQGPQPDLPFAAGEVLTYRAVSGRFGSFGTGVFRVAGPEQLRGTSALKLSFDFKGRVGPFRVEDRTRSWIARDGERSLRYEKNESSPLGRREEEVEIYPAERRWQSAAGEQGSTPTPQPLDELSFIYYLRSLPLEPGDEYSLTRHFDVDRNPVVVRVLRRERTRVPAGEFATVVVEMRVRDDRLSEKDGTMRIFLTDDDARIPVRIESSARWVGATHLLLESAERGAASLAGI